MPTENEKPSKPDAASAPYVADPRIKQLEDDNASLKAKLDDLQTKFDAEAKTHAFQAQRADDLEKKLKAAKSAPTGDVVYLGGESHSVVSTVRANTTFDEVKKGNVEEGATLVVIAKPH